jgi:hypothetical protein
MKSALSQLKASLFESVSKELVPQGFKLRASKESFIRRRNGASDIFQLTCKDGKPGWKVEPGVAVRVERVEEIFHWTSGFKPQYHSGTATVGAFVGHLLAGSILAYNFFLVSDSDLALVAEQCLRIFREVGLPYYERWGSLRAIDAELNDDPSRKTPHRSLAWFRCSTGIIVARLVGRPDIEKLASFYTKVMTQDNRGFYLKRFQDLLESLESVKLGEGLGGGDLEAHSATEV